MPNYHNSDQAAEPTVTEPDDDNDEQRMNQGTFGALLPTMAGRMMSRQAGQDGPLNFAPTLRLGYDNQDSHNTTDSHNTENSNNRRITRDNSRFSNIGTRSVTIHGDLIRAEQDATITVNGRPHGLF